MELIGKTKLLFDFVKEQHGNQVRKYTGDPYFNHLLSVVEIVFSVTKLEWLISIALCHDLYEDTQCTETMLRDKLIELDFAPIEQICDGVNYLTDHFTKEECPELNRTERKQKESERLWTIPFWAQTIKYADLIDNTKSIIKHDPKFAKVYLEEKRLILSGMRNGNSQLLQQCDELISANEIYNDKHI